VNWTGNVAEPDQASTTVILTGDKAVTANFKSTAPEMISIQGGSFMMGSDDGYSYEKPVHSVNLDGFEISLTEITQGQYESVMKTNPSYFIGNDNLPVGNVSFEDAARFCNLLSDQKGFDRCYDESLMECDFSKNGFRLPTEAEWEYACRAGTTTQYYTGDNESDLSLAGWYDENEPYQVGQKVPNSWGLYDMHGNMAELCNDWYSPEYYSTSPENNPTGPQTGSDHVIRGGSVFKAADACRSFSRDSYSWFMSNVIGFRIVRRPD
jgi:formylglycine-generating enzyme required for sulfatase activity